MKNKKANTEKEKKEVEIKENDTMLNISSIDEFDDNILEINLKRPKRAYNYFLMEMKEKEKSNLNATELSKEFSKKWKKMSDKDKEKFKLKEEEDKIRYNEHLALVRKYILEKPLKETATAMKIFIDEKIRIAMEEGNDPKEAKDNANEEWKKMSQKDKDVYEDKKEKLKDLYDEIRNSKTTQITGYTLFCRDQFSKAREKDDVVSMKQCGEMWQSTKQSVKDKYNEFAEKEKEERMKHRDLYEVAFGIKPKRPLGPYNFFLMEKAKEGKFHGSTNIFKEASKIWKTLKIEEKERYKKIAKKAQLAYFIKMMEFKSANRKPKPKSAFNFFVSDMKDKVKDVELPQGGMFSYCFQMWKKTDEATKKKYHKMAAEEKEITREEREQAKGKVHKKPKRPGSAYNVYIKDKYDEYKEKSGNKPTTEIMALLGEDWNKMKENQKKKYNDMYEKNAEIYKEQLKEYEKFGFYSKEDNEIKKIVKKKEPKEKAKDIIKEAKEISQKKGKKK